MAAVRTKNTAPELLVRSELHRLGLRFRLHQAGLPGSPDIVLKKHGVAVFVHGCFWHSHSCPRGKIPESRPEFWLPKLQRNSTRDKARAAELRELGWRILVVWECETRDPAALRLRLKRYFDV